MVLAVFAGLPGVGKSTLAAAVAAELPAAVLAVDTVDFTLRRYDVTEPRPGFAAYGVVAALAEVQLRIGHSVIIDAVNPVRAARQLWVDLADRLGVPLRVVEVVCGDDGEHRRRVEARYAARDHDGIPDWVRVLADDPAAANDIPAWCRMKDQEFVRGEGTTFEVRRVS